MYVTAKIISFYDFHGNHFKRVLWSKPISLTTYGYAIAGATLFISLFFVSKRVRENKGKSKRKEKKTKSHPKAYKRGIDTQHVALYNQRV